MKSLIGISLLLLVACTSSAADRFDRARETIRQQMVESNIPAVSVAVAKRGKIVWQQGFGWADRENRVAATEHTMYSLASLSKPITVTGLMTLVQAGKVELDQPVNNYLGDAKLTIRVGEERDVTVRRVIDHTAGLPGGSQFFYGEERAFTPSMEQTILRYGNVVTAPGEREQYSNIGYGVLSYLIERVSGRTYADYLKASVFLPLGMTHSSVDVAPGLEQFEAVRYDRMGQRIPFYTFAEPGAAAIYSSAHDLARLGMFFMKNRLSDQRAILNEASIDQMTNPASVASGTVLGNVGWQARKNGRHLVFGHSGSMAGVTTDLSMIPSEELCVVVLTNASIGVNLFKIRDAAFHAVMPEWVPMPPRTPPVPSPPFQPVKELVGTWNGKIHTYAGELPLRMQILASGDVHVQVGSQLETLLNKVTFDDGTLKGQALSQIDTADTKRHPHDLAFDLKLRGNVLNGSVAANSINDPRWSWIYSLPHWVELQKR
ncbi:serine hydrolase domain-containing protein [Steroidobacter sp.]|uniref:serine hydrolase domain-containing protein n=1 Tax=Steroidobacter sp. TaxID=1978227 RepID=UPI001A5B8B5F|nr:serine hydrolase domain-containing protein [Steroidobacter sp.]MBL8265177.1 beta-lactamase family protein [Steroidobacter sp.]